MPATHQEVALRLGTVREVVSRNLSRFQAQGLIRIQNREISILDRDGLQTEAETEMQ
jgi:CRP/FNR family transcriptional regulator